MLSIGVIALVASVLAGGLVIGAVAITGQQARTAADLAALAAAGELLYGSGGEPGACAKAAEVATRNGARLIECRTGTGRASAGGTSLAVPEVWVTVARDVTRTDWTVQAQASAGGVPLDR